MTCGLMGVAATAVAVDRIAVRVFDEVTQDGGPQIVYMRDLGCTYSQAEIELTIADETEARL
ncbi:MAG: hypothetical protein AAFY59_12705 [Pseudomonadota bacterium]